MATAKKNLSVYQPDSVPDGTEMSVGIVASEWNEEICENLLSGAVDTLTKHGVKESNIHVVRVPGAFELPYGASILLKSETLDGILCLGCVIKGETRHDEYINSAVASGITQLGLVSGKPVTYGVITAEDEDQALDRSGGKHGNKGIEGAVTLLRMISLKSDLGQRKGKHIGF